MTYPGDGQGGWGQQPGQGGWGQQPPDQPGGYPCQPQQPQPGGYPQTGGFPLQPQPGGYGGQYGGLGVYGSAPQPPKNNRNKVILFSALALVVVVGGAFGIYALANKSPQTPVAQSTSSNPPTTTGGQSTTRSSSAPIKVTPVNPGWQVVRNDGLQFVYEVPTSWKPDPSGTLPSSGLPGTRLTSLADRTRYTCEGKAYSRGVAGVSPAAKSDLGAAATSFAKAYGSELYASTGNAQVTASEPKAVERRGSGRTVNGMVVEATITTSGSNCLATSGKIEVLALEARTEYVMFVLNVDTEGGPADPAPVTVEEMTKILESARPAV